MPAHLQGSAPKVQHSSEFTGSELTRACKTSLEATHVDFQQAALTASIKGKEDEVKALEAETTPAHVMTTLQRLVSAHVPSVLARNKLPVFITDDQG